MNGVEQIKIGIIYPELSEGGGSKALKYDYDVTLITTYASRLDEYYRANLGSVVEIIKHPLSIILKRMKSFDAIRGILLSRFCRSIADSLDLLISAYNVMDLREKGIQCIADFTFGDNLRGSVNSPPKGLTGIFYRETLQK